MRRERIWWDVDVKQLYMLYNVKILWQLNWIKFSLASNRVSCGFLAIRLLTQLLAWEGFTELYMFFSNPFEYAIYLKKDMPEWKE
jgi:hypothetical protein